MAPQDLCRPLPTYDGNFVHYCSHWFWNFGNGGMSYQGGQRTEIARRGMQNGWPMRVNGDGRRYGYRDRDEMQNTEVCTFGRLRDEGKGQLNGRFPIPVVQTVFPCVATLC